MQFILTIKHQIGDKIKSSDRIYTVIGYEHVSDRGLRYILLYGDSGKVEWIYLYEFEIDSIIEK
jgi:hypothetical protein